MSHFWWFGVYLQTVYSRVNNRFSFKLAYIKLFCAVSIHIPGVFSLTKLGENAPTSSWCFENTWIAQLPSAGLPIMPIMGSWSCLICINKHFIPIQSTEHLTTVKWSKELYSPYNAVARTLYLENATGWIRNWKSSPYKHATWMVILSLNAYVKGRGQLCWITDTPTSLTILLDWLASHTCQNSLVFHCKHDASLKRCWRN